MGTGRLEELYKRLAHLSVHRLGGYDWIDLLPRIDAVVTEFEGFVASLSPAMASWFGGTTAAIDSWTDREQVRRSIN